MNESTKKIKVIVCDDHVLFRQGIKASMAFYDDIEMIAEAGDGNQLMGLLKHMTPDIVLLDINMPIMDGIETLPKLKQDYPDLKVIVVSMHNDVSMILKMIALGANSYLTKGDTPDIIHDAIRRVYEDDVYFTPLMNKALLKATQENEHLKKMDPRADTKQVELRPQIPADNTMMIVEKIVDKLDRMEQRMHADTPKPEAILHWEKPEDTKSENSFMKIVKSALLVTLLAGAIVFLIWAITTAKAATAKTASYKIESNKTQNEAGQTAGIPSFEMGGLLFR